MGNTEQSGLESKVDGLIFWDVDFDKLAAKIGRVLEQNPPTGMNVIRYTGEKNYTGWHKVSDGYIYAEDASECIKSSELKKLQDMDAPVFKAIDQWEKELIRAYKAKFSIELHDTPRRAEHLCGPEPHMFDVEFINAAYNSKLSHFLNDYCKRMASFKKDFQYLYTNSAFLHTTSYHQITVEIIHDPLRINELDVIKASCEIIKDLSRHMREEYPSLWKKKI